jgi:sterol desaturase/sphingolipid hydroxylase (fatty acid hydroxylase superfamily)
MDFSSISTVFSDAYGSVQEWIFSHLVAPLLYQFDLMSWAEDVFDGIDWFLFGCIQILLILVVLRTWERFSPAEMQERFSSLSKADVFYTLFHRLGIFHGLIFIALSGFFFEIDSILHDFRFDRFNVESWWPGVTSIPVISFLIYLVLLDFVDYLYHRASHAFNWWWQLHALHHSQRHMSVWTDNRNHILDDLGHSAVFALVALIIGVEPIQYLWLLAISQLIQSWQHGNFDFDHGIFKYILISPRYHRLHHAIGLGYEVPGKPDVLGGCNFGILFPWWDMLFGTAIFTKDTHPTGVRGLEVSLNPFTQQWQGLLHALKALFR